MTSQRHIREVKKESRARNLHRDWRVWVGLLVMLGAIVMYVLSLDDSIIPR